MEAKSDLAQRALDYHAHPTPGKISVVPTKTLADADDLSLAYSPGVAFACMAIHEDGDEAAAKYTSRANLVGVISNGTAVLGLGNIGPLASKPVMEGKGCLFKKFAGIDVFDIELAENDPEKLVDIIAAMEPTLGGINLEDIKAPECFYIETELRKRMKIPVFHDDQHGTAIIASAAIINGLEVVNKKINEVRLVCSGAGAAAIACLNLLVNLGLPRENIYVTDSRGVIWKGREDNMEHHKAEFAQDTELRTLADAVNGADIFLGCSGPGLLTPEMLLTMNERPLVLALANPDPEIRPEIAKATRPDVIIATGRSDYPNQVNNVLCFPFIFRGALDCGATEINEEMKRACVEAIAHLAREEQYDDVNSDTDTDLGFGPDYIIPKPFDPRLIARIAPAVAKAAMETGVASRPIEDLEAYRQRLIAMTYRSGALMRPLFKQAKELTDLKRVIYADGEDERVLRAAQTVVDEKLAYPILVGRPSVIEMRIKRYGLRLQAGINFEIVDPEDDYRFNETWQAYYQIKGREGVTPEIAKALVRKHNTLIGAMLIRRGDADAMICGVTTRFDHQLVHVEEIIGRKDDASVFAAMNALMLPTQNIFVCDTHVNENPSAEEIADITLMAAEKVRQFGLVPRVALLSHSNFGSRSTESSRKMALARQLIVERAPDLEIDGEMHADSALSNRIRFKAHPDSTLTAPANLLITPNLDAGNITYNVLKMAGSNGVAMGPILLGAARPVHILTTSTTTRRIINMTAIAALEATELAQQEQV
ncbi:NADP-dependent malic enzyme [Paenalcaligenes hominis]|uniref:Malate dehydrogenase (Oxaloacetate-decarboxylating)(NADP+) n=1 Tax=Paenalcaligenes hominis TaxID=643674 RepID=A0ABX0WTV7_9BURK|nr:NADP-dependent malic enzyme [Paenalcaligenes hominis]NJB66173.1 malate dehydrogenase (oxaloacetate-decarboxylating)(NADP+) [Paenalcaligenes hominis]GGE73407.1 NADP-dependent malic enzyme [Paenalcaligenes hominis]